ncbi:putative transcriptional regulator YvhJ [Streptomyces afghaniensis 772]|uniref:Putative transcriptional regulator YvhJ n=1 Tax=Streptomyces afghaniensis 772 TaxID=1283301 RepID=S4MQM0_9ACTN|nr:MULTISPECIES: LCP family protein [Streptomyces]EPJ35777.1 putative transcriptional regulator YvhJ [Streptomyces afghaniensis 772]UOB12447.1 LCP family protein [Streptomyces sp. HP-A2021]
MAQSSSVYGEGTKPGAVPGDPVPGNPGNPGSPAGPGDGHRRGGRRPGRGPGPGRGRRVLRWSAASLSVLILATAGAGYLYYEHLNGNIEKGRRSSGDSKATKASPNAAGQTPLNILLIGSDSRASDENVKLGGARKDRGNPPLADVQMLIHLAADRKSAAVVSIPRDTRVDIPKCTDPKTGRTYPPVNTIINASLARGGAGCTLATWENLTGVYVDHWMTIDFAGVVKMADAIGGVEVCVRQNVWDRPLPGVPGGSGLKLKAGHRKVQGEQALQWLRTRHAWGSDPLRARAQHMYMNSMIRTLKAQNVFTDTGRLTDLAEAATKSLHVSEELGTVKKLYDLGMQLKTVPTDRITMTTLPTAEDPQDRNHLVPAGADADRVWDMIRDDVPFDGKGAKKTSEASKTSEAPRTSKDPAAADDAIGVLVQNATRSTTLGPVTGRAGAITRALVEKGFTKAAADTSGALSEERTVVRYPSAELAGDAQRVAKSLGIPASSVRRSTDVSGVTVVVGADWRTGTAYPKQPAPKAGDLPGDADALNGSDTGKCMDVYAPYRW